MSEYVRDEKEIEAEQHREERADRLSYLLSFNDPVGNPKTKEQLMELHSNQDVSVLLEHAHGLGHSWTELNTQHAQTCGELSRLQKLCAFLCAEFDVDNRYGGYVFKKYWESPPMSCDGKEK